MTSSGSCTAGRAGGAASRAAAAGALARDGPRVVPAGAACTAGADARAGAEALPAGAGAAIGIESPAQHSIIATDRAAVRLGKDIAGIS